MTHFTLGPTLLNSASPSLCDVAPTLMTDGLSPGEPNVSHCGPELPAAKTGTIPTASQDEITAS